MQGSYIHPQMGSVRYEAHVVSDDPQEQVEQVVAQMSEYAVADSASPEILSDLSRVVPVSHAVRSSLPGGCWTDSRTAAALFYHVQNRMRFQRDEDTVAGLQSMTETPIVEGLVRPVDMAVMERGIGDCDDYAMYLASLLLAAGIPCAFVTVAADPQDPSRFSHVYVAAYTRDEGRIPLDASHGEYPGWETEYYYQRREWPLHPAAGPSPVSAVFAAALVLWICSRARKGEHA